MPARGAVLLPMVIMIGAVVLTVGTAGLLVGVVLTRSVSSMRMSERALQGARAGVDDARRRIIRDPRWSPSCPSVVTGPVTYSLSLETATADVCVAKAGNSFSIQSLGSSGGFRRRIDAVIGVDPATDRIRIVSSYEVAF